MILREMWVSSQHRLTCPSLAKNEKQRQSLFQLLHRVSLVVTKIMATITDHEVVYAGNKKIHYLAAGPVNGPLILFIHGWPSTAITWKAQLDAFAAVGFRAIAPDMPGYGQSTARRVADDYCQEALVEGMMALLADTGRKAAIWVGHDWGSG